MDLIQEIRRARENLRHLEAQAAEAGFNLRMAKEREKKARGELDQLLDELETGESRYTLPGFDRLELPKGNGAAQDRPGGVIAGPVRLDGPGPGRGPPGGSEGPRRARRVRPLGAAEAVRLRRRDDPGDPGDHLAAAGTLRPRRRGRRPGRPHRAGGCETGLLVRHATGDQPAAHARGPGAGRPGADGARAAPGRVPRAPGGDGPTPGGRGGA